MHAKYLALVASAALARAGPIFARSNSVGPSCAAPWPPTDPAPPPALPTHGAGQELPAVPPGLTLKYIALGLGIQNYSCSAAGAAAVNYGAVAMLYDITDLYPGQSEISLTQSTFNSLTAMAVEHHSIPLNFNSSTADRLDPNSPGADLTNPFTASVPLQLTGMRPMGFLGYQYFTLAGVPYWYVNDGEIEFLGAKLDALNAPTGADPGPQGTGATTWLYLGDKGGSIGAKAVYRVETAGGNGRNCSAAGFDSVPYSAQYWIYD